jgi:hypothetical protein
MAEGTRTSASTPRRRALEEVAALRARAGAAQAAIEGERARVIELARRPTTAPEVRVGCGMVLDSLAVVEAALRSAGGSAAGEGA